MRRIFVVFFVSFLAFTTLSCEKKVFAGEPGEREPAAIEETKSTRYLSWTGNWRMRWNWIDGLDLDDRGFVGPAFQSGATAYANHESCVGGISNQVYCYVTNSRTFAVHRLRVDPVIHVTDDITVYTQFDALANGFDTVGSGFESNLGSVWGGNTGRDFTRFGAPLIGRTLITSQYQNLISPRHLFGSTNNDPDAESISTGNFRGSNADFNNMPMDYVDDFYDGEYSQTTTSDGDDNFRIRRVWLEYNTPYGIFKVGRMPRDWGLGIRLNSGSNVWDHFGDTFDSVLFEAGVENYKFGVFFDKIQEGDIDVGVDDTDNVAGYVQYTDPEMELDAGLMYTFFVESEANIFMSTVDPYFKKQWGDFYIGWEGVFGFGEIGAAHLGCDTGHDFHNTGNASAISCVSNGSNFINNLFLDLDILQIGTGLELAYNVDENLTLYSNAGYASGQDNQNRGRYEVFAFDRNYDIALIMFNHGVGRLDADLGFLNWRSVPYSNAVNNAIYVQAGASYDWTDQFNTSVSAVWGYAARAQLFGQGRNYGVEADFIFGYEFSKNLHAGLDWGILFAGDFYEGGNSTALDGVDGEETTFNGTPPPGTTLLGYTGTTILPVRYTQLRSDIAWLLGANLAVTF